jgi:phosphoribosylformimino-5-aminoimidazole carboxamide ribotide isomerase
MRLIGVIDVMGGRAVHARGGRREHYQPVRSVADRPIREGDASALARAFVEELGLTELYVADLDAIMGRPPQDRIVAAVTALGVPVWVDAGVSSADRAREVLGCGAAGVIVGLETLTAYDALERICAAAGGERVVFSLDLRGRDPVAAAGTIPDDETPEAIAASAARAGAQTLIALDMFRVGASVGPDVGLIARLRASIGEMTLVAGGGVRGLDDLQTLAAAGCDGALVATALLDGSLDADRVARSRHVSRAR